VLQAGQSGVYDRFLAVTNEGEEELRLADFRMENYRIDDNGSHAYAGVRLNIDLNGTIGAGETAGALHSEIENSATDLLMTRALTDVPIAVWTYKSSTPQYAGIEADLVAAGYGGRVHIRIGIMNTEDPVTLRAAHVTKACAQ
jgi:hypothetical protein